MKSNDMEDKEVININRVKPWRSTGTSLLNQKGIKQMKLYGFVFSEKMNQRKQNHVFACHIRKMLN